MHRAPDPNLLGRFTFHLCPFRAKGSFKRLFEVQKRPGVKTDILLKENITIPLLPWKQIFEKENDEPCD